MSFSPSYNQLFGTLSVGTLSYWYSFLPLVCWPIIALVLRRNWNEVPSRLNDMYFYGREGEEEEEVLAFSRQVGVPCAAS